MAPSSKKYNVLVSAWTVKLRTDDCFLRVLSNLLARLILTFPFCSNAVPHCSTDVGLIPPYDRVILETAFRRINSWAINTLREAIIYADDTFKKAETRPNTTPDDFHGGLSLGALPVARFLLATLGILTAEHNASDMSLILNSGTIGLTQTIMRLAGPCEATEEEDSSLAAIIDEPKAAKKVPSVPMTGPDVAKRMKIGTRVVRGPDWKWGDQVPYTTLSYLHVPSDLC